MVTTLCYMVVFWRRVFGVSFYLLSCFGHNWVSPVKPHHGTRISRQKRKPAPGNMPTIPPNPELCAQWPKTSTSRPSTTKGYTIIDARPQAEYFFDSAALGRYRALAVSQQ